MFIATMTVAVVLATGFVMLGVAKLADAKPMAEARVHLGLPIGLFRVIGALEVLGGAGVLLGLHADLPLIGVLASIGLIGMTIGAAFYHQRAGDAMSKWIRPVAMGSIAVFYIILRIATL